MILTVISISMNVTMVVIATSVLIKYMDMVIRVIYMHRTLVWIKILTKSILHVGATAVRGRMSTAAIILIVILVVLVLPVTIANLLHTIFLVR